EEGSFIGTLHAGNLTNNYFTGKLGQIVERFADAASIVVRNSVLYNETVEMRNKIEHIFSKFVPREVINDLLEQTEEAELQLGEKRHVAIIFSDIRSFTVISEYNNADMIVDFLNRYFDRMSQAIRKHGGFIDKFIGDAILAVFGAPVSYEDNAERAVRASLDMKEALKEIETGDLVLPDSGFNIGIGVHEGQTIVGNLGSRDKFDYTVIGDNVNLASRLEGLTKHYHEQIIVSDVLASSLEDEFILREVDTVKVKGKEKATTLYAVRSEPYFDEENLRNYTKGLSMFKLGNWITGKEYFEKILEDYPEDFLCDLYRTRCIDFAADPPDEWDGAIKLDFK
ncbi:MAG: adenylate/guanylate cyclase domain-containing protein, partial [Spirochaetia bacterium]